MNIDTIREFVTLANIGSFEEAAFHLFLTQSALSKHIQGLETELGGLPLLTRGHGKVDLTEFGKQYYPYAEQIVQTHDGFINRFHAETRENTIRVGCPPHMDAYGFFDVIKTFCRMHPEYSLLLEDEKVTKKLRVGEVGIAIMFEDSDSPERDSFFLRRDRLVPILPAKHPLAGRSQIRVSDLREERFVFFSPRVLIAKRCKEMCRQAGFEPTVAHYIAAPDCRYIIDLVSHNFGVSIVPEQEVHCWQNESIFIAEPDITIPLNICVQCDKGHTLSDAEIEFIKFLQQKAGN